MSSLKAECGFGSLKELNQEADQLIKQFSQVKSFDPYFKVKPDSEFRAAHISRKKAYVSELRNRVQTNEPLAQQVASVLMRYQSDPKLRLIAREFLLADFSLGEEGGFDAPACTSYGDCSVVLPPKILASLHSRLSASDFKEMLTIIVGHEIGHYVHDIVLHDKTKLPYRQMMANVDPARYHLLVDAVGMRLSGATPKDVIKGLKLSVSGLTETGDIPQRLNCWSLIQSTSLR
ncbi:MAG: hypothetical protein EOP05_03620 [Proteobacteria bacterium]|nr:MAG: hypothetical protein EOP05_03620 [Pseudomonadota bacterium]